MSEPKPAYEEAARVTRNMKTNREAANEESRRAVDLITVQMLSALGDERLLGTPNLGISMVPLYAYQIRSRAIDKELDRNGKESLVLSAEGRIEIAWRTETGLFMSRPATEMDYRAEDLPRILEVANLALKRHLEKAESRSKRFEEIRRLADKTTFILGE
jgi:hypothetical protein